jgi:hypothetical protein
MPILMWLLIFAGSANLNKSSKKSSATESSTPFQEPQVSAGDIFFENAILYLHDAHLSREFTDAVKAGDSGRVVLVMKVWVFSFQGNGRTKYAHKMLHLIHNIEHVWPKETRYVIIKSCRYTYIHFLEILSLIIGFSTHLKKQTHGLKLISCRSR